MIRFVKKLTGVVLLMALVTGQTAFAGNSKSDLETIMNKKMAEEVNVPVITLPGKSIAEAKKQIAKRNLESKMSILNKDEKKLMAELKTFANSPVKQSNEVSVKNAYSGTSTPDGALVLAYNDRSWNGGWCSYTLSGYCHAGLFDKSKFKNKFSLSIHTANRTHGKNEKKLESPDDFSGYSEIRIMTVPLAAKSVSSAVGYARNYKGPYSLTTTKYTSKEWYCSKVVFKAYWDTKFSSSKVMDLLDIDGGFMVTPGDLRWSALTKSYAVYE